MNRPHLIALAILKANWDVSGSSYLRSFVPFVADCLRSSRQSTVSLEDVGSCLIDRFGLDIPRGVVHSILKRASRDGIVKAQRGVYLRNDRALGELDDIGPVRSEAAQQLGLLNSRYRDFAENRFGRHLGEEQAEDLLLEYVEQRSVPILRSILTGSATQPALEEGAGDLFILNSFVKDLYEQDADGFTALETVVKGSMLAAGLYVPNPGEISRRFDRLTLLLDTAVILGVLGLKGEAVQHARKETLDLAYELGASLGVLRETLTEVRGVLSAAAHGLRAARKDWQVQDVEHHFRERGFTPSDVDLLIGKLPQLLQAHRIREIEPPAYTAETTMDEAGLEARLQGEVRYTHERARTHDLAAISAVHRMRRGRTYNDLEESKAIFVTTNTRVVRASTQKLRQSGGLATVPYAITESELATLAWLKRPQAAPDLPRRQIIADCYSALYPGDALWSAYLTEIDKLEKRGDITLDDYYILRYSQVAQDDLMELTLGDAEALAEGTVEEVLDRARRSARADLEQQLARERGAREEERERREQAEGEAAASEGAAQEAQSALLSSIANKIAHAVSIGVGGIVALLLLGATWSVLAPLLPDTLLGRLLRVLMSAVAFVALVFTSIASVFGLSLRPALRWLEMRIAKRLEKMLGRWSLPPAEDSQS